jgi:hypothetical protein
MLSVILIVIMLSVIMLNVIMQSVVMLNVVMLSVVAPKSYSIMVAYSREALLKGKAQYS